jgi:hypothetical protein
MITIDTSPPQARWMKDTLDRSVFHRTVPVLAARVRAAKTGSVLKAEAMRGSAHLLSLTPFRGAHAASFLMKLPHQLAKGT